MWILQYLKSPHAIKVVTSVQERIDGRFIPDSWVSAYYLRRCYERKGGKEDGYIKSFEEEFGRYGKKKVCYLTIKLFIIALAFFFCRMPGVLLDFGSQGDSYKSTWTLQLLETGSQ